MYASQLTGREAARKTMPSTSFMGRHSTRQASFTAACKKAQLQRSTRRTFKCCAIAQPPTTTTKTDNPLKICFVAAEVSPWSKTGGLGDVVGGLPVELAKRGHKVSVAQAARFHAGSCQL